MLPTLSPSSGRINISNNTSLAATSYYTPVTAFNHAGVGLMLMLVPETSVQQQRNPVLHHTSDLLKTARTPRMMSPDVLRLNSLARKSAMTRQLLQVQGMTKEWTESSERTSPPYFGRINPDTVFTHTPNSPRVSSTSSNLEVASVLPKKIPCRSRTASDAKSFFRNLKLRKAAAQNMIKLTSPPARVHGKEKSSGLVCHRIKKLRRYTTV